MKRNTIQNGSTQIAMPQISYEEFQKLLPLMKSLQNNIYFTGNVECRNNSVSNWVIYMGESHHMCVNNNFIHNIENYNVSMALPNGEMINVQQMGDVHLQDFYLNNVRYVPAFRTNLNQCVNLPNCLMIQQIYHMVIILFKIQH